MNLIVSAPFRGHSQSSTWGSFMAKYVLIVDDNEAIRRTLRYLFKENPEWTICGEATNGRDALEKAHELQPDLVILDFSMPVMNGLETATMLKKTSPRLPIVMLTAFKDRFLEQQAFNAGVSWVLSKTEDVSTVVDFARILLSASSQPLPRA
jgi:DNA-binding NarL/FixJ family response regulator